ncbi:MAG: glycoside hydrolase family 92 protein, partial [Pedobacter sp.]
SHRLGEVFSILPSTKEINSSSWTQRQTYDSDLEVTRPWYYSTYLLDSDVKVEFVPGKKSGFYKFTFPQASEKNILLAVYNAGPSSFKFISNDEVIGLETYHGNINVYMYGKFTKGAERGSIIKNQKSLDKSITGSGSKVWLSYPKGSSQSIQFKYAISYVSADQAKANFEKELIDTEFESLVRDGEAAWSKVINQIEVKGGTEAQKRSFYTALYRTYERMVDINEYGHYFSGFDNMIHTSQKPFYVDDWAWDTYLAQHPLRIILDPAKEQDMLNSYIDIFI